MITATHVFMVLDVIGAVVWIAWIWYRHNKSQREWDKRFAELTEEWSKLGIPTSDAPEHTS